MKVGKRKTHPSDQIISSAGQSQALPQSDFFWPQTHIRNVRVLSVHAEALEKHPRVKEIKGCSLFFFFLFLNLTPVCCSKATHEELGHFSKRSVCMERPDSVS